MNKGDLVIIDVNGTWVRGVFLEAEQVPSGTLYRVGVGKPPDYNCDEVKVPSNLVKLFVPMREEARASKLTEELPKAFNLIEGALKALLPEEKVEIKDDAVSACGGAVTLSLEVDLKVYLDSVHQEAGWQVTLWKYDSSNKLYDIAVGDPTNLDEAVRQFVENVFYVRADAYWDSLVDEHQLK